MYRAPGEYEENKADVALRQGLRHLPVPEIASDFDTRVHAALRRPAPWWRTLWTHARPALSTAAYSLLITLVLLRGLPTTVVPSQRLAQSADRHTIVAYRDLDRDIDRNDLSAASLNGFVALRRPLWIK